MTSRALSSTLTITAASRIPITITTMMTTTSDGATFGGLSGVDGSHASGQDHDRAVHFHQDASCPSVIIPAPAVLVLATRMGSVMAQPVTKTLHGTPPVSC